MKNKKVIIVTAVSVLLCVAMIAVIFVFTKSMVGDVDVSTDDIADYGQWDLSDEYTKLSIFPAEVPASATEVSYRYKYQSGYNRPMCQIYLECKLPQAEFDAEVERLRAISYTTTAGETNLVQYDTENFSYPAYVTMLGYDFAYEYALVMEQTQTIAYIFTMNTLENDVKFDESYLPEDFMADFDNFEVDALDRFTMYERYRNAK